MTKDPYKALGVSRTDGEKAIRKAFAAKALALNPAHNPSPEAQLEFRNITEAYGVLSDPTKRQDYDRSSAVAIFNGRETDPRLARAFGVGEIQTPLVLRIKELQEKSKDVLSNLGKIAKSYETFFEDNEREIKNLGLGINETQLEKLKKFSDCMEKVKTVYDEFRTSQKAKQDEKESSAAQLLKELKSQLKPYNDFELQYKGKVDTLVALISKVDMSGIPKLSWDTVSKFGSHALVFESYNFSGFYKELDAAMPMLTGWGKDKDIKEKILNVKSQLEEIQNLYGEIAEPLKEMGYEIQRNGLLSSEAEEIRGKIKAVTKLPEERQVKEQARNDESFLRNKLSELRLHNALDEVRGDVRSIVLKEQAEIMFNFYDNMTYKKLDMDALAIATSDQSMRELKDLIEHKADHIAQSQQKIKELELLRERYGQSYTEFHAIRSVLSGLKRIEICASDVFEHGAGILTIRENNVGRYDQAFEKAEKFLSHPDVLELHGDQASAAPETEAPIKYLPSQNPS